MALAQAACSPLINTPTLQPRGPQRQTFTTEPRHCLLLKGPWFLQRMTLRSLKTVRRNTGRKTSTGCKITDMESSIRKEQTRVLFVCLGNICRSPTAEAVFKAVVQREGLADAFFIDSCGTGGGSPNWYQEGGFCYHTGDLADRRMQAAATKRGINLTSRSRPLTPQDLHEFDYIIGMDDENIEEIHRAARHWGQKVPEAYGTKVKLMCTFLRGEQFKAFSAVPDPYYGGAKGFETVLDLLEDACEGLLADINAGM